MGVAAFPLLWIKVLHSVIVIFSDAQRLLQIERERLRREQELAVQTNIPRGKTSMGMLIYMQAFLQNALPEGTDPNSPEALELCKYLRISPNLTPEEREAAMRNKISSWSHSQMESRQF